MPFSVQEKQIIRELALAYRAIAEDPVNAQREKRARRINALTPDRPLIWVQELPWHELNIDQQLTLRCEHPFARSMEQFFRRTLLQWKYFQGDMVVENCYRIQKSYHFNGDGLESQEEVRIIDQNNHIISHAYSDLLDSEEKLCQLQDPVITALPDQDAQRLAMAEELLQGILPVRLHGSYIYATIWDRIARYRGVEPIYMDLVMNPDLIHKTMQRFTQMQVSMLDQMEQQGLFSSDIWDLHCTPGWSDELDAIEKEKGPGMHSTWYRGMAQNFGSISPDMHAEFEIDYIRPIAEKFGFTYYGCCEPLHDRIDKLQTIKNLRKIGVSPWADVWASAEQIGTSYVLSRKPNPAAVAGTLDEDAVRAEIQETCEACIRYNCPCDISLKDISTVGYRIENLTRWVQIAEETVDRYYGK